MATPNNVLLPCDKLVVTLAGGGSFALRVDLPNAAVAKLVLRALARRRCGGHPRTAED